MTIGKQKMSYRLVVADDQPEVRRSLRRFIERDGRFEIVAEAENGAQAIDAVASSHPDALIMDLAMPGVDGLVALESIMRSAPATRVAVLSSMIPFNGIQAKALELGAIAAFDKYTSPKKVIKALAKSMASIPATEGD